MINGQGFAGTLEIDEALMLMAPLFMKFNMIADTMLILS